MSGYQAIRNLLAAAEDLPAAEVVNEEDGEIGFDWSTDARCVLSVSVREDGRMSWAALIGPFSSHGTCSVEPDDALRQVMKAWTAAKHDLR